MKVATEALVLDTNIVSYLMKRHELAEKYRPHLEGKTLAISFMTIGEMFEGAHRRGWSKKKFDSLREHLKGFVVVPYSANILEVYGRLRAERKKQPIAVDDGLIAATAIANGCPLLTHNPDDFVGISNLVIITELKK
jgi:predicted nucleic acid-binding protein